MQVNKMTLAQTDMSVQRGTVTSAKQGGFDELLLLLLGNQADLVQPEIPGASSEEVVLTGKDSGDLLFDKLSMDNFLLTKEQTNPMLGEASSVKCYEGDSALARPEEIVQENQPEIAMNQGLVQGTPVISEVGREISKNLGTNTNVHGLNADHLTEKSGVNQPQLTQNKPSESVEVPANRPVNLEAEQFTQQRPNLGNNLPTGDVKTKSTELNQGETVKPMDFNLSRPESSPSVKPSGEVPVSQFPQRISEMVKSMMLQQNPGHTMIKMKLLPQHLGEVTVKLSWAKGELSAQFIAATSMAKDALESAFPQLKQLLAQQDIRLSEAAVFMEQQTGQWEQGSKQHQWQYKGSIKHRAGFFNTGNLVEELANTAPHINNTQQGLNIVV